MPQLTASQWRVVAKALRFARDICEEAEAQPILDIIGEEGEKWETGQEANGHPLRGESDR